MTKLTKRFLFLISLLCLYVEASGALCYLPSQSKPIFSWDILSSEGEIWDVMISIYGKQRATYIDSEAHIDGDIVESYYGLRPVFSTASNPKLGKGIRKIKLENYHPSDDLNYRAKKPQWLGKVLEFSFSASRPKWLSDFDANNPKKRYTYFTVTVDGKTTYQCGDNPTSFDDVDSEPNG